MNRLFYISFFLLIIVSLDTYLFSNAIAQQVQSATTQATSDTQSSADGPTVKPGYHYIAYSFIGILLIGSLFLIWNMTRQPALAADMLSIGIEGITVILIVASVVILALTKTITSEGTVGLLGSIVGYVLGKKTSNKKNGS